MGRRRVVHAEEGLIRVRLDLHGRLRGHQAGGTQCVILRGVLFVTNTPGVEVDRQRLKPGRAARPLVVGSLQRGLKVAAVGGRRRCVTA